MKHMQFNSLFTTSCETQTPSLFDQTQDLLNFFAKRAEPSVTVYLENLFRTSRFIHQEIVKSIQNTRFIHLIQTASNWSNIEEPFQKIPKMYLIANL